MDNSGNSGWDNGQNHWNQQNNCNQQNNQWNNGYQQTPPPPPVQRQPVFYNGILNRQILKQESREIMRQNYGNALVATIVPGLIVTGISVIPYIGGVLGGLFGPIFLVGGYFLLLELIRGYQAARAGDMFNIFGDFGNVFGASFMTNLFVELWSLLLVVPGIYKYYCWSQVQFILADNPRMTGTEARNLSDAMMEGHKMELFELQLSFIGWFLLSLLTAGIVGVFYVNPWYQTTIADYYDNLKMLYEARQQQTYSGYQENSFDQGQIF